MKLNLEHLEAREVPAIALPEAFPNFIPGYEGPLQFTGGHFDAGPGLLSADIAAVAAEDGGGSVRVVVRSGGIPGTPLVIGPDGIGRDPSFGLVIHDKVYFDESFRGGGVISSLRSPLGHSLLAISPGVGGGPLVAFADLTTGEVTVKLALDINYRGGVRLTQLPPLSGAGAPDSLILATPAPGGGGGPVATIFNGRGEIVRSFMVGPADDRSGNYQPIPYGAGVSAPDGSGVMGSYFAAPDIRPYFVDIDGVRRFGELTGGAA